MSFPKVFGILFRSLVYSNLWISLGAFTLTWWTAERVGGAPFTVASFVGLSTFLAYNAQRLVKTRYLPSYRTSHHSRWMTSQRKTLFLFMLLAAAGAGVLALQLSKVSLVAMLVGGLLSGLYALPFPKNIPPLREWPYLKIYLIAFVWVAATALLPVLESEQAFDALREAATWGLFAERFCFLMALTIPFDIRDAGFDAAELRTIAQRYGGRKSTLLALWWLLLSALAYFAFNQLEQWETALALLAYVLSGLVVYAHPLGRAKTGKKNASEEQGYYALFIDGLLIFHPLLMLLGGLIGGI